MEKQHPTYCFMQWAWENYLGVGSRFGFTVLEREAQIIRLEKRTYLEQMYRLRNNGVKTESYKEISTWKITV